MVGDVAQATDDSEIGPVVLGEVVEVLEEIDRRFELGHHGVEGGDRIAGAAGSPLARFGSLPLFTIPCVIVQTNRFFRRRSAISRRQRSTRSSSQVVT